jgi:Uma2 family endonuclease
MVMGLSPDPKSIPDCNWISPRSGLVDRLRSQIRGRLRSRPEARSHRLPLGQPPSPARGLIHVPPDITIEIVSPTPGDGRRDRVEKMADYTAFGVAWYWLLDPQLRSPEILQLAPQGRYIHVLGANVGTLEKIPGCKGLTLNLYALWAASRSDRHEEPLYFGDYNHS